LVVETLTREDQMASPATKGRLGHPPLLDGLRIKREPRGLLGRFFLDAEARLAEHGITLRRADFGSLLELHLANKASWRALVECFDTRMCDIRDDDTNACFIGYDQAGVPVTCVAVKYGPLGQRTVREVFEDLSFLYGEKADAFRSTVRVRMPAESAGRLTGNVFYPGAFWVHPSRRGEGFGYILPEIARFYAMSQWPIDFEVAIASFALRREDIQRYTHCQHHEDSYIIETDAGVIYEGLFMWSTADYLHSRLDRHVRQGLAPDGLVNKVGDQNARRSHG
jgi:hypothetical protein